MSGAVRVLTDAALSSGGHSDVGRFIFEPPDAGLAELVERRRVVGESACESAVNLAHVQTVEQNRLVGFVGTLSPAKMQQVCRALAIATGCS